MVQYVIRAFVTDAVCMHTVFVGLFRSTVLQLYRKLKRLETVMQIWRQNYSLILIILFRLVSMSNMEPTKPLWKLNSSTQMAKISSSRERSSEKTISRYSPLMENRQDLGKSKMWLLSLTSKSTTYASSYPRSVNDKIYCNAFLVLMDALNGSCAFLIFSVKFGHVNTVDYLSHHHCW